MPGGRPSKYTVALADKICESLAFGKSLLKICDMKGMPTYRSVMRWVIKHEEFCHKYEVARKVQRERWADEIIDIPDDSRGDVQRARLRVDSRKWVLARLEPRKYGDKLDVASGGEKLALLLTVIVKPEKTANIIENACMVESWHGRCGGVLGSKVCYL